MSLRRTWQFFVRQSFSSLTRRIIFLNLTGLLALVIGILYLSQFRAGLIDARVQSLLVQGEIIAGAIAASATVDTDTITIDPERLLDCRPARAWALRRKRCPASNSRSIPNASHRSCAAWCLRPTRGRAIYDRDGVIVLDSRNLYDVLRYNLPPPTAEKPGFFERAWIMFRTWLNRGDLPLYRELGPENGKRLSRRSPWRSTARRPAWCASTSAAR